MIARDKKIIAKLYSDLGDIRIALEEFRDSEQDSFDSKSEKWQESDKGEATQEIIAALEEAVGYVESAESALSNITDLG